LRKKSQTISRLRKSKFFIVGIIIVLMLIILSITSPYITVFSPTHSSLSETLTPPEYFSKGWNGHILGTDNLGRDILTRLLIGSRVSLYISLVAVFFIISIGVIAGLYSAYYGGWIDNLIMRFADIQLSIPYLLLAIAIVAILGPSINNLILVLIITGWPQVARVVRGAALGIKDSEFVLASKAIGASNNWIIFSQILPNIMTPLLVVGSQRIGQTILIEAALSFLGLGVQPPIPSWGIMISDGRQYLMTAPWIMMYPGLALMVAVLAFNFVGDGLRDVFDPKMKT